MAEAIIETGGKQYLVSPKEKLAVEKLPGQIGDSITFDKVLYSADGEKILIGKPFVGSKVTAKILEQSKADKIVVFKYRAKSRYRRKSGHRQRQTVVEIEKIGE